MHILQRVRHLIIDMDGVLYVGNRPMPCLREFFDFLRERPIPFVLATNNSTRSASDYVEKLAGMGVTVAPEEVLVSGQATARYLAREYPRGTRAHVFGMAALREAMAAEGFELADERVELVVASMDREVNFDKLKRANALIRGGARFIATNLDPTNPSEEGLLPGTGAMIAALEAASGVKAQAIGKPEPIMYELAMQILGASPETTAAIGDRADTDILGGKRAGLATIFVLSGSDTRTEGEAAGADLIYDDIAELLRIWRSL